MKKFPTRQVHLDFHTSQWINGIGQRFDKAKFQKALKDGHIESITVFGKCHHSYCYYPTKVGHVHPGLAPGRDFVGELMDACHEIGVRAPLYLPIGWSALDAELHPEWVMRDIDGNMCTKNYDLSQPPEAERPECSWLRLCTAGGYRQHLWALTEEVCSRYAVLDGLFFDITLLGDACYCDHCVKGMEEAGMDPKDPADAARYFQQQKKITMDGLVAILHRYHPRASVFFNSGGADILKPQWHYLSTHYEMEDLPTVWGGYDKLPMRARYFHNLGKDYLGMTGKFHRGWGEFGGYKTPEALTYECAAMLSCGAGVSIGDQMHPDGEMDEATYRLIGKAYSYVEKIEDYCFDTRETAKLGVFISNDKLVNEGMAKLLLDSHVDFDVVTPGDDLQRFTTLILPDRLRPDASEAERLDRFVARGGKVLLLGGSGLRKDEDTFAFRVPFTYLGRSSYDKDFFRLTQEVPGIVSSPVLCYRSAHRVAGEGRVYAEVFEPYFSRTYGKYCSHYNTPYRREPARYPGAVQSGNILYVAHELAGIYAQYGAVYHKEYFRYLLRKLYSDSCIEVEMPSQGRLHLVKREKENQYVLHLLYAPPIQRGEVSVLEDFPELTQIPVKLNVPETVTEACLVPQMQTLPLKRDEKEVSIVIPRLKAHQMVVFSYEACNVEEKVPEQNEERTEI